MLKAALIGCGAIGFSCDWPDHPLGIQSHASAYHRHPGVVFKAVCDANRERAKACADAYRVPGVYTDIRKLMLDEKPEVISIATDTNTHAAVLDLVLEHGVPRAVICEKPLAGSLREGRAMVEESRSRDVMLYVNHGRRFLPAFQAVRSRIQTGDLGEIRLGIGLYTKGILHNGSHLLDLLHFWLGRLTVNGVSSPAWTTSSEFIDAELITENGGKVAVYCLKSEDCSLFELDLIGSTGRLRLTENGNCMQFYRSGEHSFFKSYPDFIPEKTQFENGLQDMMQHVVDQVVSDIQTGRQSGHGCTGGDGLAALKLAEDIRHRFSRVEEGR